MRAFSVCLIAGAAMLLMAGGLTAQQAPAETVLQIQALIEQHDLQAAQAMTEGALRRHPEDGGLDNLLGVIAAQSHQPRVAAAQFQRAIRHRPTMVPAYLNLARIYLESPSEFPGAEDKAEALYKQALRLDPKSDEAHIQLASIFERHHKFNEALVQVGAVSRELAGSIVVLSVRCSAAAAAGDQHQADAAAEQLARDPDLQGADVLSMVDGLRAGRRADLLETLFLVVASRQPLTASELELLGLAQDANGKPREARETLERAFAAEPHSTAILADLAHVAEHQEDGQAALGYLAHARDLAPKDASLAYEFGQVCVRMKLLGEARNALESALALQPENPEYNLSMGKVTALSQDPLRALPYLQKYQALRPKDADTALLLGVIYNRVKDFDAAEPWLRRAAENAGTAADAHLYLGSGYRQQGQLERARKELEHSARLNDLDAETHAELGLLALQTKSLEVAGRELQRAIALEAENYTGNFGLLQLYAQTSDPRRKQQLARFERIKEENDALNRQAMRVIEVNR